MTSALDKFLSQFSEDEREDNRGNYKFKFGKYKNKTYDEVFEEDPKYVAWILKNNENKYFASSRKYYLEKIEKEYKDSGDEPNCV
jgi:3'-phosphoadenosine 5'-phosphosulfate sulfotransferase